MLDASNVTKQLSFPNTGGAGVSTCTLSVAALRQVPLDAATRRLIFNYTSTLIPYRHLKYILTTTNESRISRTGYSSAASSASWLSIASRASMIYADVVVAADGVLSLMAEKAGLREKQQPRHFAVSMKEVIELPRQTIEDRFNLEGDEGLAQLFFGELTQGMMGGGFLYTNLESISLGLVVGIESLMGRDPLQEVHPLMEAFKERPEIRVFLDGGEVVEYSAHVITEGGVQAMPKLFSDGILVVGDAAGFGLNMLITVRGMEYALASGAMAAQAVQRAKERGDFSASTLAHYEELLRDSFVLKDMHTFRHALDILENPRLVSLYPQVLCDLFEKLMWIDDGPKQGLFRTALGEVRGKLQSFSTLRDLLSFRKM